MSGAWRISDDAAFVVSSPQRVILLNLAVPTAQPIALLGTGATIWQTLMGAGEDLRPWVTRDSLLQHLCSIYGTDRANISKDVDALLNQLSGAGYLIATDTSAQPGAADYRPG